MPAPKHHRVARSARDLAVAAALLLAACASPTGPEDRTCGDRADAARASEGAAGRIELSLVPGASCALRVDSGRALRLAPSTTRAEYLLAVQSASTRPGERTPLRLSLQVSGAVSAPPPVPSMDVAAPVSWPRPASPPAVPAGPDAELALRRAAMAALSRAGAIPARGSFGGAAAPAHLSAIPAALSVGDTIALRIGVDPFLTADCRRTETAYGVIRAVGDHFVVAEDTDVWGAPDILEYRRLLETLDRVVYPATAAYFGEPADLDGNGRVIAFFTPVVNRATPRGSGTFISGFFSPIDLSEPRSCPASNRGELLYLRAPDPYAAFGDPIAPSAALDGAVRVVAHELTHLIEAGRRIQDGGGTFADLEEPWLAEGLAHAGETVVGMAAAGLAPRANYGHAELASNGALFDTFQRANFNRASQYLANPAETPALGGPAGADPGGVRSLEMRGFAWLFLRWMADHAKVGGGGYLGGAAEEAVFRDLIGGGPGLSRGTANVERVAARFLGTRDWRTILSRYGLVPLADDANGVPSVDGQLTSFDLPDVFAGMNGDPPSRDPFPWTFPLTSTAVDLSSVGGDSYRFEVSASATAYFVLATSRPHGAIDITLTGPTGAEVPESARPQIVVHRTK